MSATADFVVVGGGIAGASAAYELAAHGRVVLFEREPQAGYHTTGRSAALFTVAWEKGLWRGLAAASRAFLESPPDGFVDHRVLHPLGVLMIGRADQRATVEKLFDDASATTEIQLLDEMRARELCPVLRPDHVAIAAYEAAAKSIDVDALHQAFLRGVRRRGGDVRLASELVRLERRGAGWSAEAGGHVIDTPVVVNAAGAWCDVVAEMAGVAPIGLVPKRRTAFTFAAPAGLDVSGVPMVIDVDEQFYFKPDAGQFIGSLADATPMHPHDVKAEERDVALAIERINVATTFEIAHVRRTWAGLRSFVADGVPAVGEDPDAPGFFWLAGQGGAGILTSPAMSRLTAGLVTGDADAADELAAFGVDASALAPSRFRR